MNKIHPKKDQKKKKKKSHTSLVLRMLIKVEFVSGHIMSIFSSIVAELSRSNLLAILPIYDRRGLSGNITLSFDLNLEI